jgi:hypothetical protein
MAIKVYKSNLTSISTITCALSTATATITLDALTLQSTSTFTLNRSNNIGIFLGSKGINWQPNTTYSIVMNANFVVDVGGNPNAQQTFTFTTDYGPSLSSISVTNNEYISIVWNRTVYPYTGTLYIYNGAGTLKGTISGATGRLSTTTVTNDTTTYFVAGLLLPGTTYYITATYGLVSDSFPLGNAIISLPGQPITTVGEPAFNDLSANLTSSFTLIANPQKYHGYVNMISRFSFRCLAGRDTIASANLTSSSTLTAKMNILSFQINVPVNNFTATIGLTTYATNVSNWGSSSLNANGDSLFHATVEGYISNGYSINWGDGTINTSLTHTYSSSGLYVITVNASVISGIVFPTYTLGSTTTGIVTKIYDWGVWDPINFGFYNLLAGHNQLTSVPKYFPNTYSGVFDSMFQGCVAFNDPNIKSWFSKNGTNIISSSNLTYSAISNFSGKNSLASGTFTTEPIPFGSINAGATLEFWLVSTGSGSLDIELSNADTGSEYATHITLTNNNIQLIPAGYTGLPLIVLEGGQWHHIALQMYEWNLYFFVDGVQQYYIDEFVTINPNDSITSQGNPVILSYIKDVNCMVTVNAGCYLQEFRISDVARYSLEQGTPNNPFAQTIYVSTTSGSSTVSIQANSGPLNISINSGQYVYSPFLPAGIYVGAIISRNSATVTFTAKDIQGNTFNMLQNIGFFNEVLVSIYDNVSNNQYLHLVNQVSGTSGTYQMNVYLPFDSTITINPGDIIFGTGLPSTTQTYIDNVSSMFYTTEGPYKYQTYTITLGNGYENRVYLTQTITYGSSSNVYFYSQTINPGGYNPITNTHNTNSFSVPGSAYSSDPATVLLLHCNNSLQDSSNWDGLMYGVGADNMFNGCVSFNQDLSGWNVQSIQTYIGFDTGATSWTANRPNWPGIVDDAGSEIPAGGTPGQ